MTQLAKVGTSSEESGGSGNGDPLPETVDYTALTVGDYISNYPVYYNNVATWFDADEERGNIPADEYTGWRVLSKVNGEVKLVSAGVPINFYHPDSIEGIAATTSVENLTTNFFNTEITNTTRGNNKFYKSGFLTGRSGTAITNIANVRGLFNNSYTDSDVIGYPKVQALTKVEVDTLSGNASNVVGNDLLAIPCKAPEENEYAQTWLATSEDDFALWFVKYNR